MTQPGWYPDPSDPTSMRWHDGTNWTDHRTAAQGAASAGGTSPLPAVEPADDLGATRRISQLPQQGSAQTEAFTKPAPQSDPAAGGYGATAPTAGGYGASAAAPGAYGASAYPSGGDYGAGNYGSGNYGAGTYGAGYGQPTSSPTAASGTKKGAIIVLAALLVLALLGGGGWLLFKKDKPNLTFAGKKIAKPEDTLVAGEKALDSIVSTRHGAKNGETRCYFAVPKTPASGQSKTDVDDSLKCGPVLFVDGDSSKAYLSFPLKSDGASPAVLTPASEPESKEPAALPADVTLKRPDGKTPPDGSGGLAAPEPPRADKDVVVAADLGTQTVAAAPEGAAMAARNIGVRLVDLGEVERYGFGDEARRAPEGQKLIAFTYTTIAGDSGSRSSSSASLKVDTGSGSPKSLPRVDAGQKVVVAVPESGTPTLVLDADGLKQTISLTDGKPGADNVLVATRKDRSVTFTKTIRARLAYSRALIPPGAPGAVTGVNLTVTVKNARLFFWDTATTRPVTHPRDPSKAYLRIETTYVGQFEPGQVVGFEASWLKFTPKGGTAVTAKDLQSDPDRIFTVFEVPADITEGTLTISGRINGTASNTGNPYTITLTPTITVPVKFS